MNPPLKVEFTDLDKYLFVRLYIMFREQNYNIQKSISAALIELTEIRKIISE